MNSLIDAIVEGAEREAVADILKREPVLVDQVVDDMTPLLWAAQLERADLVSVLLEAGANPDAPTSDGETPLHVATFAGSHDCVDALLVHGADPNASTSGGKTPLMNAAQSGSVGSLRALLGAGAMPTSVDEVDRSALHWAILGSHDDAEVCRALLSAGLNPLQVNENGDSATDYAREMGKPSLLAVLTDR
jgi:ankyrin repeat protein